MTIFKRVFMILILIWISGLAQEKEQVIVQKFSSPAEFNRSIPANSPLAKAKIYIYKEKIDGDRTDVVFIDEQGTEIKRIPTFWSYLGKQQTIKIDYDYNEAFIITPKLIRGNKQEIIRGVKYYTTEVYDSTGLLLFSFQNNIFSLKRLNKKQYITYPVDILNIGPIYIVDERGQKIHDVKGIEIFTVVYPENKSMSLLANGDGQLVVLDSTGATLWTDKIDERIYYGFTMSNDGKICFVTRKSIFVLDQTGSIIQKIPYRELDGWARARISNNGKYVFWGHWSKRRRHTNPYRDCQLVLYDLHSNKISWKHLLTAENEKGWNPVDIGISQDCQFYYAKFFLGDLILYNRMGNRIYHIEGKKYSQQVQLRIHFIDHKLFLHNMVTNSLQTVTVRGD
ncbi:MAG: hypothetical protein D6830_05165 [Ignavibacteria bacterium]|nr:MAG: hypothetical protein D6830_05165 [Ignavibacteria bacterium]